MAIKRDRKERCIFYRSKFKKVDKIIEEEFKDKLTERGFCHTIWARKKQLLKEMFNIDWKTPAELNPNIIFE